MNYHVTITDTKQLEQFGLSFLTGERDATMTGRLLFDLSEEGANLVATYFSLTRLNDGLWPFEENWNQFVGDKPAEYSVMLPATIIKDLIVFALITRSGVDYVYANDDTVWTDDGETWHEIDAAWAGAFEKYGKKIAKLHVPDHITVINRWRGVKAANNMHQMSGRF